MGIPNASVWVSRTLLLAGAAVWAFAGGQVWAEDVPGPEQDAQVQLPPEFSPRYVPGEVIVKLRDGRVGGQRVEGILPSNRGQDAGDTDATLLRLRARYGVQERGPVFKRIHRILESRGQGGLRIASSRADRLDLLPFYVLKTDRDVRAVCAELQADPEVQYAQPNYIYRICRTPDDPDFPDQYAHQLIQMEDAWEISTGSRDIVVAVADTGVDVNHPDLKDNIWVNEGEIPGNKVDDDGNGYVDDIYGWNFGGDNNDVTPENYGYDSVVNHGTQVSGVIAAVGNNGVGVSGVNWQCSIMALRLSLDFTTEEIAEALDYAAANGARVVNMSFGGDVFGPEGDQVVNTAIDSAYERGVLLVASAGNSDTSRPHYPAAYYNVMAVASTNGEDLKTGHSTFGPWVDIAAPGTDIVTTDLGNKYIATAGTSFSAPYVAAVGALLLAHRPNLTPIEVRAILENTTDPVYYGDLDPDLGYVGTGRVNAFEVLQTADEKFPLGEIAAPAPGRTFTPDVNAITLRLLVHGDSYQLDYRGYGHEDWTPIAAGDAPVDANGLVELSLANPGVGTYELRLQVSKEGLTHVDRKIFGIAATPDQAPWPMPETPEDPLEYSNEYFISSPLCLDVNGDGRLEIIQTSVDLESFWGEGKIYIWNEDGNSLPGWPAIIEYYFPTSVAVGDIDGDGDYEIVTASDFDSEIRALHVQDGEPVDGNWPVIAGDWVSSISAGPVLADLDGDGDSEIIVALSQEARDIDGLYAIQGDGTFMWQRRYTSEGPISVADFDLDGDVEIALCGYGPGLSRIYTFILDRNGQQIARWRGGSPKGTAIADLDGDGRFEMVFCTEEDVMAVRTDGSTVWKTRAIDPLDTSGTLSVGDVDGDGFSEVYVNCYVEADGFAFSRVYGFDYQGHPLASAGFPKTIMGYPSRATPLIADIDGDGQKELIVGSGDEPMMAWEADGSVTPGFPLLSVAVASDSAPALEDLDQDGDLEIMATTDDYRFHVFDLPAPYTAALTDWGMLRHDPQNSGWTLAAPRLDPVSAPAEIKPGMRLEVPLSASNPANLPLRWAVGNLPEGAWYDPAGRTFFWKPTADQACHTYVFSFLVTDGVRQDSRSLSVTVVPDAIYYADMGTDPNWTLDEGWAWGTPAGNGSWNGDPNAGYTGENVIGYALDGDYEDDLGETRYATTGPIDCTGYRNIRLSFRRWLGVEAPYDYACIQVSTDGVNWTDLWTTGLSHISDSAWHLVEYAVPAGLADNSGTVFFRWGLGPTDEFVTYAGWNIDDVQVTGERI